MSKIEVKMFPAKNGDCFLISLGSVSKQHILIDCGYAETYNKFLKDELKKIGRNNEMVDLMVITHVDQDHILGAIRFLEDNNRCPFIKIKEIWHNSYRHLQFEKEKIERIPIREERILKKEIGLGNSFVNRIEMRGVADEGISTRQGSSLASLILEGGYLWNEAFDGKAVNCDSKKIIQKKNFNLHLLSPNTEKLKRLSDKWLRELKRNKMKFSLSDEKIFDDAFEFFMIRQEEKNIVSSDISLSASDEIEENLERVLEYSKDNIDDSIINGSSISFVIEYCGKKLLFLADAHPDIILENLSKMNTDYFDLVKVSHHGSKKNTTNQLAKVLHSNLFLISTNGEGRHAHPDLDSIVKIIYHQMNKSKKFIFNYETNTSKFIDNEEWKNTYNYSIQISDGSTPTIVEL
ncbi:hypothetical protein COL82_09585 [Bacillus toyonensis]|uniref:MBL fold metallo-hydrolase n=1 Tax=Bacillus toyonensis TaxID=155322 RepID=UPI000BF77624|nr:MBL fold metallo-hydrolase [Bacillus toyonensis]PFZ78745.1 hypothetical protein COL82_09585 [Bacillus toyonensis]